MVLIVVQRSANAAEFDFMMENLLACMPRTNNADKQSVAELEAKAGDIATWQFIRRYFLFLER